MKLTIFLFLLSLSNIHSAPSNPTTLENVFPHRAYRLYGQALEAIFSMGLKLQAIMDSSTSDNFVVSPISTTAIIAQLMIGAEGEFREQLHDLLSLPRSTSSFNVTHFSKDRNESQILPYANFHLQLAILIKNLRQRKPGEQFTLNLDNALFYNQNIDLMTIFTTTLNKMYNTEVKPLDFRKDTKSVINQWATEHTNGLIKNFISSPLPSYTTSVFLNSIYFLAEWETPFSSFLNDEDNFAISDSSSVKTTYMMGNIENVPYIETKNYKIVCLPYKNREVGMYIMLPNGNHPNKYNIKKFSETMDVQEVLTSLMMLKGHDVTIKIPKLSLSNSLSILKPLQKFKVFERLEKQRPQTVNNAIDVIVNKVQNFKNFTAPIQEDIFLENAARGRLLKVSDIYQQMVFSINEKGTEAAAVSGGLTDYMGGSKTVVLNRPFSFFIKHEETQAVIFWGTISNPSQN